MALKIIDMAGIADLLGVAPVTPQQWRQRSRKGEMVPPLPEPDVPEITDKPLWYEHTIVAWADQTGRWPKGKAGRPLARGKRRAAA